MTYSDIRDRIQQSSANDGDQILDRLLEVLEYAGSIESRLGALSAPTPAPETPPQAPSAWRLTLTCVADHVAFLEAQEAAIFTRADREDWRVEYERIGVSDTDLVAIRKTLNDLKANYERAADSEGGEGRPNNAAALRIAIVDIQRVIDLTYTEVSP